jgi:Phosphatidylglycerophosphate synthase
MRVALASPRIFGTVGRMANLITVACFRLLCLVVGLADRATPQWQSLDGPLVLIVIARDAVDGCIARVRSEASVFGSTFDVAARARPRRLQYRQ